MGGTSSMSCATAVVTGASGLLSVSWEISIEESGLITLHGNGVRIGTATGNNGYNGYVTEMVTLVRDRERNQDPFIPIALVQFPVPVLVLFPRSVNKP